MECNISRLVGADGDARRKVMTLSIRAEVSKMPHTRFVRQVYYISFDPVRRELDSAQLLAELYRAAVSVNILAHRRHVK
jgi:hypothetical protein